jgi:hypothetical protein
MALIPMTKRAKCPGKCWFSAISAQKCPNGETASGRRPRRRPGRGPARRTDHPGTTRPGSLTGVRDIGLIPAPVISPVQRAADRYTPVVESGPVFADPSGRRHRVLRFAGLGAAAVLAVCLGFVAVAMTGGPQAPFTQWAAPQVPASPPGGQNSQAAGHSPGGRPGAAPGSAGAQDPVAAGATGPAGAGTTPSRTASPSPSAGSLPSATATASTVSPAPTNPAGKTPPGHTKSAHPHASASAT